MAHPNVCNCNECHYRQKHPQLTASQTAALEPVEIKAGPVLYTLEDDGLHGFTWTASRDGVLTSKGWIRTRSAKTAELAAKAANSTAFAQDSWHPDRA